MGVVKETSCTCGANEAPQTPKTKSFLQNDQTSYQIYRERVEVIEQKPQRVIGSTLGARAPQLLVVLLIWYFLCNVNLYPFFFHLTSHLLLFGGYFHVFCGLLVFSKLFVWSAEPDWSHRCSQSRLRCCAFLNVKM